MNTVKCSECANMFQCGRRTHCSYWDDVRQGGYKTSIASSVNSKDIRCISGFSPLGTEVTEQMLDSNWMNNEIGRRSSARKASEGERGKVRKIFTLRGSYYVENGPTEPPEVPSVSWVTRNCSWS